MTERVMFYAPLKSPYHPVPSGDRRMARALMAMLRTQGHQVEVASRLRSFDRNGDLARQTRIKTLGARVARRLIKRYQDLPISQRPEAWITYHAYHKSPDWLGPVVRRALNLPYLLIETSFAAKQAGGGWDLGHQATKAAIRTADVTLAMTAVDEAGLSPLIEWPGKLRRLPPFLDPKPYQEAAQSRERHRQELTLQFGLDINHPWLLAVGMMRDDVKRQSYALLADGLKQLLDRRWQLLIIGDGISRPLIERFFEPLGPERVKYAGIVDQERLPACYAAADVYAWPAVREAYGMALLEAQASGLPVIAGREGGVADIMRDGVTGMLIEPRNPDALAVAIAELLDHPMKRRAMATAALSFIEEDHSLDRASRVLDQALIDAPAIMDARVRQQGATP